MLTITLHWWAIPTVLVLIGLLVFWADQREGGMFSGLFGGLFALAMAAVAGAVCLGHWLA